MICFSLLGFFPFFLPDSMPVSAISAIVFVLAISRLLITLYTDYLFAAALQIKFSPCTGKKTAVGI